MICDSGGVIYCQWEEPKICNGHVITSDSSLKKKVFNVKTGSSSNVLKRSSIIHNVLVRTSSYFSFVTKALFLPLYFISFSPRYKFRRTKKRNKCGYHTQPQRSIAIGKADRYSPYTNCVFRHPCFEFIWIIEYIN